MHTACILFLYSVQIDLLWLVSYASLIKKKTEEEGEEDDDEQFGKLHITSLPIMYF